MDVAKKIASDLRIKDKTYYTIGQLRFERWSELKEVAGKLKRLKNEDPQELTDQANQILADLMIIERYWAFPGWLKIRELKALLRNGDFASLLERSKSYTRYLVSETYRYNPGHQKDLELFNEGTDDNQEYQSINQHYFETLFVDDINLEEESELQEKLGNLREPKDQFVYNPVFARSFEDAIIAMLFNYNIQVVVIRFDIIAKSTNKLKLLRPFISSLTGLNYADLDNEHLATYLAWSIKKIRPEIDLYYVTNHSLLELEDEVVSTFRRIFYRQEDLQELHLSIQRGLEERYETPFFSALVKYSQQPTSVFHAMPISRGNSVYKSFWIRDFGEFYGRNLFLAETSATTGGLDSLLQPTGPLKKAQEMAAKAFGSRNTYFVTNGTSTANKIVQQAIVQPGDYVLIDRDCHKSHHYSQVLSGGFPIYLDSYPIEEYSMYGAVPLSEIKEKLLLMKDKGVLDQVKMLVLTNCTFDGLVYNVEKVMQEILAIKPNMVFLWDEAWFGFAAFTHTYKKRTAMYVARKLRYRYLSQAYRAEYKNHIKELKEGDIPLMPDPDKVVIRTYSTQSTHKTLSSFRQGSMIHVYDEDFPKKKDAFLEAYMTHTSTSANYQILASMDVGRRQVQFEGFEMVEKCIELSMILRAKINDNPKLKKYFDVLTVEDFIPKAYRKSGLSEYYDPKKGWNRLEKAWGQDEFVLDPTKINLHIGRTGVDGDTFKNRFLMDKFNIQINKTSRNSVLFMTNIGTTRGSIAYLVSVLLQISKELDEETKSWTKTESTIRKKQIKSLCEDYPSLPDFSAFHESFRHKHDVPGGDIRKAYYLAYSEENYDFVSIEKCLRQVKQGKTMVSCAFVIPYPPGFPVLVPGQIISTEILEFMIALDVKEIHGYQPDLGLQVFTDEALIKQ
ncbi:MAG: aminotransferase class I/II-fold pyridoxal phosphate-dependent enzyme [Salibacteraceae bacterium]